VGIGVGWVWTSLGVNGLRVRTGGEGSLETCCGSLLTGRNLLLGNPEAVVSNTRTRTRLRIVPTGNRARRPNPDNNNDPSEEPRATNLSGNRGSSPPANRIPF
jgi:hypothetical protein